MFAIFKRELRAYFISPIGYIFIAVFLIFSGFMFTMFTLRAGADADVTQYFMVLLFVFIVLIPLLTMRMLSEERKLKTEQVLLTAPVSLGGIIMGKFCAAFVMFAGTLLLSCTSFAPLYSYGEPNTAVLIGNVISILLIGAAFISIGLFISALTENQLIAAIVSIGVILFLLVIGFANSVIDNVAVRTVISWISVFSRYYNFTYGIFDFTALIYYFSIVVIFIFLTVRIYEKRRWE